MFCLLVLGSKFNLIFSYEHNKPMKKIKYKKYEKMSNNCFSKFFQISAYHVSL